jgi:hypothetical protein
MAPKNSDSNVPMNLYAIDMADKTREEVEAVQATDTSKIYGMSNGSPNKDQYDEKLRLDHEYTME